MTALFDIFKKKKKKERPKKIKEPEKIKRPKKKVIPKPKEEVEVAKAEPEKPAKRPSLKKRVFKEAYKILKEPHISEKATILNDQDKYVFKVYPKANKIETKKAIEGIYGVKVKDINIINVHRKKRILRGIEGFKTGYKKAIITLEEGEKIEITPR